MEKQQDSKRSFLKHILAGTCAIAGTAAITRSAGADPAKRAVEKNHDLYHETSAFNKYYKSLRA